MTPSPTTGALPVADPYWFKRSIFYEVLVRASTTATATATATFAA
jgi:hypothetical protein